MVHRQAYAGIVSIGQEKRARGGLPVFILVPNRNRQTSTILISYTVTRAKIWPQQIWGELRLNQIWSPNFGASDHTGDGFDHNITNIMSNWYHWNYDDEYDADYGVVDDEGIVTK